MSSMLACVPSPHAIVNVSKSNLLMDMRIEFEQLEIVIAKHDGEWSAAAIAAAVPVSLPCKACSSLLCSEQNRTQH